MDYNSSANQRIKSKLVDREVHACVTSMVEYILSKSMQGDGDAPFSLEDAENLYDYPEYSETVAGEDLSFEGGSEDEWEEFKENFDRLEGANHERLDNGEIEDEEHDRIDREIDDARYTFGHLESEIQEVYEWWLVTGWLCEKLKEHGEVVLEDENIWGRCTTGQAIILDGVIGQIAEEMGILEGQEHSWAE